MLARFDPEQHERTGFITAGDKTYMFSCEVISTTDESQHADFHIIFLRDYLETVNQKLAEIPGAKLEIIEFQGMTERSSFTSSVFFRTTWARAPMWLRDGWCLASQSMPGSWWSIRF